MFGRVSKKTESLSEERPIQHFPDTYSIKAVGVDENNFAEFAADVVRRLVDDASSVSYRTRPSRNGSYLAVTLSFVAVDQQQLDAVFEQMSAQDRVVWVL